MDKFLNLYSKYPWAAIILVLQWLATAIAIIYARNINVTDIMGITFLATVIYAYIGFKVPKG